MTKIVNCPIVNDQAALLLAARSRELCRQVAQAAAGTGTNTMNGTQTDQLERSTIHAIAYTNSNKEMESISSKASEASKRAVELKRANSLLNGYCTGLRKKLDELLLELNNSAETNEELSRELLHQLRKQKNYLGHLTTATDSKAWRMDALDELKRLESMMQIQVSSTANKVSNPKHLIKASKSTDKVIADHATLGLGRYLRHLLADMNAAHKARESQLLNTVRRAQQRTQVAQEGVKQILLAYV
ncbi:Uveal autoantigen with coiled-coil domains and ankyrin repeats protein [Fasciolopsis buskii]|uniref:Uveal autoantigen with coiled-coil domains and ankyrin repeats protein n=1 Tax=Fasciolopsis buskii TaxID=27845 RepID=A0A8E0RRX3_9TREM|nr:Uveal autoantigen with coiled-coil domains and ankyrin repeats protein [Fasciolopsis buski]